MRLLGTALSGVLACGLCHGGGQERDPVKEEMKKLQGTWTVESLKVEGKESTDPKDKQGLTIFRGDKIIASTGKEQQPGSGRPYRLDPSRNPKRIDIGGGADGTLKGIYALDGDTLTLCVPNPFVRGERPTKFESDPGGLNWLMVLKRKTRPQSTPAGPAGGVGLAPVNYCATSLASPAGCGRMPPADRESLVEARVRHGRR